MSNYKLSELGVFKNGANYPQGSYGKGDKIVNVKDLFKGRFVNEVGLDELKPDALKDKSIYTVEDGDILFTRSSLVRSGAGMCAMIKKPQTTILFCGFIIRYRVIKKEIVNPVYLLYLLRSPSYRKLFTGTQGTNITNINQESLGNIEVDLPPLETQNKIVNILSTIDDKIELNNKINSELEAMAKEIYEYWFVQFDFPDKGGKPYKSSGGKMVWNDELKREIPEGWDNIKFDDLVMQAPKCKAIKAPDYKERGKYPIVDQASNLITGYTDEGQYVYDNPNDCVVFGDVTTIFKYINFPFAKGTDGTKIINTHNNRIPAILLYHLLKDTQLPNVGFARHYIFLREIQVLLPAEEICKEYSNTVKPMMDLKVKCIMENEKLSELRDFLLPMLMNGQVTVK